MGKLIITEFDVEVDVNIPIALTKSVADIKFPDSRQGHYSKTVTIEGGDIINKAFTHIYDINGIIDNTIQYSPSFNPNKKAKIIYAIEGVPQINGYLRLLEIKKELNTSKIIYQCQVFNEISDFWNDISKKNMSEIDLSKYNHELSASLVRKSWDQNIIEDGLQVTFAKGKGYVHALINKRLYGGTMNMEDPTTSWDVGDTTPCLYAKELVDAIYRDAGQTYVSGGFFDSPEFKNWVVPYNGIGLGFTNEDINDNRVQAQSTVLIKTVASFAFPPYITRVTPLFQNDSTGGNQDLSGAFDTATSEYIAPLNGDYYIAMESPMFVGFAPGVTFPHDVPVVLTLKVTNVTTGDVYISVVKDIIIPPSTNSLTYAGITFSIGTIKLKIGDTLNFSFDCYGDTLTGAAVYATLVSGASLFVTPTALHYGSGSLVNFDNFISKEVEQKDFMMDMVKTFNLWIDIDSNGRHIVETRDEFLGDQVENIQEYINTNKEVVYEPMGALDANPYIFTYTKDEDSLNSFYAYANQELYGTRTFDVDNDFIKAKKEITVTYSPTVMRLFYMSGMSLCDITFLDKQGNLEEKDVTANYRLLRYEGIKNCNPYHIVDSLGISLQTGYPLIGHIDDALNPTMDGLFGLLNQHYLNPSIKYSNNNLFYQYHLRQYAEITDKNSKIVTAELNITPDLYPRMSFDKVYWFDNSYFRLNKIIDYKDTSDTKCEFIKIINYAKPITQVSTGNGGRDDVDVFGMNFPVFKSIGDVGSGLGAGDSNYVGDSSLVIGSQNVYSGDGVVSLLSSSENTISPVVQQATLINTDGANITADGLYIDGVLFNPASYSITDVYVLGVEFSTVSTSLVDVSDLSFTAVAGDKYKVELMAMYKSDNVGNGIQLGFNVTATATLNGYISAINADGTVASEQKVSVNAASDSLQVTAVETTATFYAIQTSLILDCTTGGDFTIQMAATSNTTVMEAGGLLIITKL